MTWQNIVVPYLNDFVRQEINHDEDKKKLYISASGRLGQFLLIFDHYLPVIILLLE